jgi:RecB family endonuclease NucS
MAAELPMGPVMNCRNCNTRVRETDRSCPNCGRRVAPQKLGKQGVRAKPKSGLASRSTTTAKSQTNPSTRAGPKKPELDPDDSMEIELNDPADLGDSGVETQSNDDSRTLASTGSDETGAPAPARIRRMLVEDPELLEEGLRVYTDDKGAAVGVGFSTPVGTIDLLARDADESLVIVLVADLGREADLATQILQCMGWVGKHLVREKHSVRGMILASEVPEGLLYAAAALPDSVTIVTYRMALAFESVEL